MSTNFYVYPGKNYIPSFRELLEISHSKLIGYLSDLECLADIHIDVRLQTIKEHIKVGFSLDNKMTWDENLYAWFFVSGIAGGTDSYFCFLNDTDKEVWKEECEANVNARYLKHVIDISLELGYYWSFRRSAGQPGIINLLYGILAASLAELTDGIIYSDDGAWDYSLLPAKAEGFLKWYFKLESYEKEWVEKSLKSIKNELNNLNYGTSRR